MSSFCSGFSQLASVIHVNPDRSLAADVGEVRGHCPDATAAPVTLTMTSGARRTVLDIC